MSNDQRKLLIRTGGTIDSDKYDLDNVPTNVATLKGGDSLLVPTIKNLPGGGLVDEYTWLHSDEDQFVKDSKEFTDHDLKYLAKIIENDSHRYIIITHGTDWMARNAAALAKHMEGTDKVVAFTGSMIPLSVRSKTSDGVAGLSFTLDNITDQKPGVYVVGHDIHTKRLNFFDPATVEKDFPASRDTANQGKDQRLIFREKSSQPAR